MIKRTCALLSLALLLSACDGGTVNPSPTPPPVTAPPVTTPPITPPPVTTPPVTTPPVTPPGTQYVPTAGFWDGKKADGPWCVGKPAAGRLGTLAVHRSPLATATPEMRSLSGLSRDLSALSAQSAAPTDLAVLLPTDQPAAAALSALKRSGVTVTGEFGYWATLRATRAQAAQLIGAGTVQYAEALPSFKAVGLPTPTDATLRNQATYLPMMNTQAAWSQLELGCTNPVVAVIDSGWSGSTTHAEYNLVPQSAWLNTVTGTQGNAAPLPTDAAMAEHGTAVAGVIAMTTNGFGAGAGVAYNLAKVLPIAVMSADGRVLGTAAARGLEYALGSTSINGTTFINPYPASVINLSFGSDPTLSPSQFFQSYFTAAANQGVVIVAAVGNELARGTTDTAGLNHSIGAAGVMFDGTRWVDPYTAGAGSNTGPGVDVAAPAMAVPTMIDGKDSYWTGTSMSTPWVASQIALWMYANQQYRADGSQTLGLKGDALYNKLSACFAATGSNRSTKNELLGYGKLDTGRLVSPTETACR